MEELLRSGHLRMNREEATAGLAGELVMISSAFDRGGMPDFSASANDHAGRESRLLAKQSMNNRFPRSKGFQCINRLTRKLASTL